MSDSLPILEVRRIEAALIKEIYDEIVKRHGKAEAEVILTESVTRSAIAQGVCIRGDGDELPDLEDFADLIPLWEAGGALEVEMLHRSPEQLDFNIRRCKFSEMYTEMGLGDIGHLLSCNRDSALCVGYNPDIELNRSQTIMQGASYCDFRFTLKSKAD